MIPNNTYKLLSENHFKQYLQTIVRESKQYLQTIIRGLIVNCT